MKKLGAIFLSGTLLFNTCFGAFSDVDESHWAYSSISKMEEVEILSGYQDGSFKPSNNITLAEFAAIFSKIFEIPENKESNYFTDIPIDHWAKGYTEAIREYINPHYDSIGEAIGVTNYSYLKGLPGDIEVTREAFIYAVSRVFGYDESSYIDGEEKILFADYEDILYPKETVLAYKNKVISGEVVDGKVYIRPNRCITRAEASAIFGNLLKYEQRRVINNGEEPQLVASFSDIINKLKNTGIEASKTFMYDTQGILNSDKFILSEEKISKMNEVLKIFLENFEYEVVDKDFYSFNKGYVKLNAKCYDLKERFLNKISENTDLEIYLDELKNELKRNKVEVVEKEVVLNFIKYDGEWKLILN